MPKDSIKRLIAKELELYYSGEDLSLRVSSTQREIGVEYFEPT